MEKQDLKKLIDVAAGRLPADLVFKNANIIDVYQAQILKGDVAVVAGKIAGIGENYTGKTEIDLTGKYIAPGFIESHIHIESAYVSPEEFGRLFTPCGTTTIFADPHEIVNVAGLTGLNYMIAAAKLSKLNIHYMLPSCVPATNMENSGAVITADDMEQPLATNQVDGLAEFMDYPSVINATDQALAKILMAQKYHKRIDGHAPQVTGHNLDAYIAAGIDNDHECSTIEEMQARLARGMYVFLREGSVAHDLRTLLKGVTSQNARRCVLAADDMQAKTVLNTGHLDHSIRICIEEGLDPLVAIQMATINAAEACSLNDRGAIAPGKRADLVIFNDLADIHIEETYINGELIAQKGKYLPPVTRYPITSVQSSIHIKDFSEAKLKMHLKSTNVRAIEVIAGEVLTKEAHVTVELDNTGDFIYNPGNNLTKIAVIERHHNTGNVFVGLLKGYGIKEGAIAISIGHDSHNVIVTGTNDSDMTLAVEALTKLGGGAIIVKNGAVLARMALPIAGLMSDQSGENIVKQQDLLDDVAHKELQIPTNINPVMTLSFMPLAVIPELKITDMGLVNVTQFKFVSQEL
ncbi:adenine deaminase [Ligilactobacillus sp. WILCCON 0076]|uniref:Adenine deaminase n=1 Tax=Ligilactobacillus ubinensis TaxID=2876789 RepID=A0A9X2FG21_9LACO|nr:adenine deaminase [Ligilactobacillus ubinensis]MCP0885731.1 adenine deaminase [Ligilactobacillus ubinensis]